MAPPDLATYRRLVSAPLPAKDRTTVTDARTRMLSGPILPTLLRLSVPNMLVICAQAAVSIAEAGFVGLLGTAPLAGVALVFPLVMLMQMASAGAMGGGISSSIARALGAKRTADAEALAWHALLIALAIGAAFSIVTLGFGPLIYRSMGGQGEALDAALVYSNWVFGGAVLVWIMNSLASVLRGTGDMRTPAVVLVWGAVVVIPLSPLLIFGAGGFKGMGVRGAAIAYLAYYIIGSSILAWKLLRPGCAIRLRPSALRRERFLDILKVGIPACVHAILINLSVAVTTGFVGVYGTAAIAGYGIGARLEYLQIPIVFGFGGALVAMVGTNVGAGQRERARRIAWIGSSFAAAVCGGIGLIVAIAPHLWADWFSSDPAVLAIAYRYLHIVGPAYALLGLGMALYFSFQGTGRMVWPLACVGVRMSIIVIGCTLASRVFGFGVDSLFAVTAGGLLAFGAMYAWVTAKYFAVVSSSV